MGLRAGQRAYCMYHVQCSRPPWNERGHGLLSHHQVLLGRNEPRSGPSHGELHDLQNE